MLNLLWALVAILLIAWILGLVGVFHLIIWLIWVILIVAIVLALLALITGGAWRCHLVAQNERRPRRGAVSAFRHSGVRLCDTCVAVFHQDSPRTWHNPIMWYKGTP
jgi:hypothetical protein